MRVGVDCYQPCVANNRLLVVWESRTSLAEGTVGDSNPDGLTLARCGNIVSVAVPALAFLTRLPRHCSPHILETGINSMYGSGAFFLTIKFENGL